MLRIEIGRSRQLAGLLLAIHVAAFALLVTIALPSWEMVFAGMVFIASAARTLLLHPWQRLPRSIVALEISDDCKLTTRDLNGVWRDAVLQPSSFVTPYLTILNLRHTEERFIRSVVILPDRIQPDVFRRLRVWLRWRCREGMAEARVGY